MSDKSKIEWTDASWNPTTGCTRVSSGCDNCYAVETSRRQESFGRPEYTGLTVLNNRGDRHFNGVVKCHDDRVGIPLRWRKPRRIFVNSQSDLFHKAIPFEFIDRVFAAMALCPQHTFQVLTKRPERMVEYLESRRKSIRYWYRGAASLGYSIQWEAPNGSRVGLVPFPLFNVWIGTSVENQATADERIPHLLRCPAFVRFVSYEPALGPVDFTKINVGDEMVIDALAGEAYMAAWTHGALDWIIVGGESGKGARPFDIAWARSTIAQCQQAGVACFVKQLGAKPLQWREGNRGPFAGVGEAYTTLTLKHSKGGDMTEWPEDLRVREFPR